MGNEDEEAEYDPEYDQEYDYEYDAEEDGEDAKQNAEGLDIDPKLKNKYAFLFKTREEMTANERRWKWVRKECLPEDLSYLMEKLSKKKKETVTKRERKVGHAADSDEEGEPSAEFETKINLRNDLILDYTLISNVNERL